MNNLEESNVEEDRTHAEEAVSAENTPAATRGDSIVSLAPARRIRIFSATTRDYNATTSIDSSAVTGMNFSAATSRDLIEDDESSEYSGPSSDDFSHDTDDSEEWAAFNAEHGSSARRPNIYNPSERSFFTDATDGSEHSDRQDKDYPPLQVINIYHDVLEELVPFAEAIINARQVREAKAAKERELMNKLTLFGKLTPSAEEGRVLTRMEYRWILKDITIGFEFGQRTLPPLKNHSIR